MDPNKVKMESINVIIFNTVVVFLLMVHIPITFTLTIPNAIEPSSNGKNASKELPFVEYFMEHNVSQSDAKKSFFDVGVKLLEDKPNQAWCMKCTSETMRYCLGTGLDGRMLDDHCCCDRNHGSEILPWIPHSCYGAMWNGEKCQPSIKYAEGSCIKYAEIRDCCCKPVLAKKWNSIHSSSTKTSSHVVIQLVCVTAMIALWVNH